MDINKCCQTNIKVTNSIDITGLSKQYEAHRILVTKQCIFINFCVFLVSTTNHTYKHIFINNENS